MVAFGCQGATIDLKKITNVFGFSQYVGLGLCLYLNDSYVQIFQEFALDLIEQLWFTYESKETPRA